MSTCPFSSLFHLNLVFWTRCRLTTCPLFLSKYCSDLILFLYEQTHGVLGHPVKYGFTLYFVFWLLNKYFTKCPSVVYSECTMYIMYKEMLCLRRSHSTWNSLLPTTFKNLLNTCLTRFLTTVKNEHVPIHLCSPWILFFLTRCNDHVPTLAFKLLFRFNLVFMNKPTEFYTAVS